MNDFDGNQYKTQKYGNTIWMTENLRTTRDKHGNELMYYFPNEDPTKSKGFGLLYDFETACRVCPDGWKLPSNEDWEALFDLENQNIASIYKDSQYWTEGKSNQSEFSVRPAGYGNNGEHDNNFNSKAILWSSSKEDDHFVWTYVLELGKDSIRKASQHPEYAFSVRCIKSES